MLLYVFCILLYLPVGIYAGHYTDMTVGTALRMVIFDGTFYHLWYFPACILGIFLVNLMSRFLSLRSMTIMSAVCTSSDCSATVITDWQRRFPLWRPCMERFSAFLVHSQRAVHGAAFPCDGYVDGCGSRTGRRTLRLPGFPLRGIGSFFCRDDRRSVHTAAFPDAAP